jgi:hypothetical protein
MSVESAISVVTLQQFRGVRDKNFQKSVNVYTRSCYLESKTTTVVYILLTYL